MMPATEGDLRLQMKSKSSIPCTARGCRPLFRPVRALALKWICVWPENGLLDEASCLGVEEGVGGRRAQRPRGSGEAADVVIGGEAVARGSSLLRLPVGNGGRHCGRGCQWECWAINWFCSESKKRSVYKG